MPLVAIPVAYLAAAAVAGLAATYMWQRSGAPEKIERGLRDLAANMSKADEDAEESPDTGSITDACSTCEPPDDEDDEQAAKDAKRMSKRELDRAARNNGYDDAHALKRDYGLDSRSDIFVDRHGNMYAGPRQGTGTPQRLGININGL